MKNVLSKIKSITTATNKLNFHLIHLVPSNFKSEEFSKKILFMLDVTDNILCVCVCIAKTRDGFKEFSFSLRHFGS